MKFYEAFSITILVFIVNRAIPNKIERGVWDARVKATLSEANVTAKLVYRPLKERLCTKRYGSNPDDRYAYYTCLKRYVKDESKPNLFVRTPYLLPDEKGIIWQKGAGLANICVLKNNGIGWAIYRSIFPLVDSYVAAHEILHMLGALHQENDLYEVMYPYYNSILIEKNGYMSVSQGTIDAVKQCLKG